jgi:hypothetical protein
MTSAWDPIGRAKELLTHCHEEVRDASRTAVLRSEFAQTLDSDVAITLLDEGQFCRAFALAAAQVAMEHPSSWPKARLLQLADMCFHNGDTDQAEGLMALVDGEATSG